MIFLNHYRHATSILTINKKRILIDPVFAGKGTYPPIQMTKNPRRNPLIDLPADYRELINVDAVLITHNHNDHFDEVAKKVYPGRSQYYAKKVIWKFFRNWDLQI